MRSMEKLNILHTEWSDGWGGQERRIVSEMAGMQARGHRIWLATRPSCRIADEAAAAGIQVVTLPFAGKFHPATIMGLRRLIRREGIDIVNTHSGIDSWSGGIAAKLAGVGLVRTRHINNPIHRHWFNFVHYLPDRVVACGEEMRRHLVDGCDFPEAQVVSIPTGIDFARFQPGRPRAEMRASLGMADSDWLVFMVGIIRSVKRHEVALEAVARALPEIPNLRLILVGDGPRSEAMRQLAEQLGITGQVRFLGHRNDILDLLEAADAFLLTSRSEGVPQAVTQALGRGLPVVATRVGGVPELILQERTGLLAAAEDVAGIAAALARLSQDPALAARLGAAGREHVQRHFSLDAMLDATEQLFADISRVRKAAR
jgi:glycosyltransferase involved in cell wall biosynthesis